jgi:hypothetical protein
VEEKIVPVLVRLLRLVVLRRVLGFCGLVSAPLITLVDLTVYILAIATTVNVQELVVYSLGAAEVLMRSSSGVCANLGTDSRNSPEDAKTF